MPNRYLRDIPIELIEFLGNVVAYEESNCQIIVGRNRSSAFLSVSSIASDSGNWLNWRGPNHNGVAESGQNPPIEFSENKNLKWKAAVPGRGHSSPIVVGDRVFLTTAREDEGTQSILCYSFDSGELLWENIVLEGMLPPQIHRKNTHASPSVQRWGADFRRVFRQKRPTEAILDGPRRQ